MEIKPYFSGIQEMLVEELLKAKQQIDIAVAWFTNHEIFDVLITKLDTVKIRLIVINDDVNNRQGGLDFQQFIDAKGEFYFARQQSPMHNKFCIIDNKVLISGSFNYTYWADRINDENVIKVVGCSDIIDAYEKCFEEIIGRSYKISQINKHLQEHPYIQNMYSYNNFIVKDIYNQCLVWKNGKKHDKAKQLLEIIENNSDNTDKKTEINIQNESALNNSYLIKKNFIIDNIVYRQWKETYIAKQIRVVDDDLVIRFQTQITEGCYIWGLNLSGTWFIQDSNDKTLCKAAYSITEITVDGKVIIPKVDSNTIYRFNPKENEEFSSMYLKKDKNGSYYDINSNNHVTIRKFRCNSEGVLCCDIHFRAPEFFEKTINLLEGKESETKDNHWHCFDINMKLNRKYN